MNYHSTSTVQTHKKNKINYNNIMPTIGKVSYDNEKLIGRGCFPNIVFEGLFEDLKKVAVKRLIKTQDDEFTIKREAELMLKANEHPNILRYFCYEMDENFLFIAMELCAGTLQDYVEGNYQGPIIGDEREILYQVTQGLAYLYRIDIIHRDIKPSNILIFVPEDAGMKPQMKLGDFGLSKLMMINILGEKNFSTSNNITNPKGTIGWMAPELYQSEHWDSKVDIFPLGCVFAYTLTDGGKHPFGDDDHLRRQIRIIDQEPILLSSEDLKKSYSNDDEAFELIQSLVEMNPENRPIADEVLNHPFFAHHPSPSTKRTGTQQVIRPLQSKNEKFDSDLTMEFLRLCTFQNLSGDDLQRFKQLVIDERVNINKTYQDGRSPLDVLCSDDYQNKDNNVLELVQLLLERGDVNVNPKLLLTLLRNWRIREHIIELVKIFMERGCDVNAKDKDGWTPLLLLFRCYKIGDSLLDLFTILVEAGADLTAKTTDGYNVLHWFFHWNQDHSSKTIDLIRYLIEKGVDVNARNMSGENPLHILCRLCTNEETLLILVKLLKENGIDLRAETKQGKTASFILRFENQAKLQANLKIDKVIDELSN